MTTLDISLLGAFRVSYGGVPLTALDSARVRWLLARLVLHAGVPQPRETLTFLLWPDSGEAQARTNLRNIVHKLRRALPDADRFVSLDGHALLWMPDAPYALDVAEFECAARTARTRARLDLAMELYRGDLLPEFGDGWIESERDRLREELSRLLEVGVSLTEGERDYAAALGYARRLVDHEPLREAGYAHLMRLEALRGDRAGVARAYHRCASALQRELGLEPTSLTRELCERLLRSDADTPRRTTSA